MITLSTFKHGLITLLVVMFFINTAKAKCKKWPVDYPVKLVSVEIDSVYDQLFQANESGWLGADAATSIVLDDKRTLWLFGDTFLGEIIDGKRVPNRFYINSTIAIQDRTAHPLESIKYYWRNEGGKDIAFIPFHEGTSGKYYWPTHGIRINDKLIIFCMSLNKDWSENWVAGTVSVVIDNPDDDPMDWNLNYFDMNIGNDHFIPQSALWYEKPYLYFISMDDLNDNTKKRRMILVRAKASDILSGGGAETLEYWIKSDEKSFWSKTHDGAITLFAPGCTETVIQYDEQWKLYYCTTYNPEEPEIYLTVATQLTGPWSGPVCIYKNPEHKKMTYTAKCHPELSTKPGELIISYVTAPIGVDIENQGMDVYRPRFIRVQLTQ
ncbi:DUF4185 domain-containing protein [bacterium]|nr:DUF4185 domain-containing protein [bacterium]MBU1635762.1 DUF4185 domain-containing protein [bacterium]MBU1875435.1 DUF4185 domain-containing protein [bacterium]